MTFSEKLEFLREAKGWESDKDASLSLGISAQAYSNYKKGRQPDCEQIKIMSKKTGIPYEFFLDDDNMVIKKENVEIGKELGLSDKSISVLKRFNISNDLILDKLIEKINRNFTQKLKEYSITNHISKQFIENVIEKIETYNNKAEITLEERNNFINSLDFLQKEIKKIKTAKLILHEFELEYTKQHIIKTNIEIKMLKDERKNVKSQREIMRAELYIKQQESKENILICEKLEEIYEKLIMLLNYQKFELNELFNDYIEKIN